MYIDYVSEEQDTFNCMGTFFTPFLTLKPGGIAICFLGTVFVIAEVGFSGKASEGLCAWSVSVFC